MRRIVDQKDETYCRSKGWDVLLIKRMRRTVDQRDETYCRSKGWDVLDIKRTRRGSKWKALGWWDVPQRDKTRPRDDVWLKGMRLGLKDDAWLRRSRGSKVWALAQRDGLAEGMSRVQGMSLDSKRWALPHSDETYIHVLWGWAAAQKG